MKLKTIIIVAAVGVGAYMAYKWYKKSKTGTTTSATSTAPVTE